jgi:membrane protein insertase Oxa1/YidC/SpoIIIJ
MSQLNRRNQNVSQMSSQMVMFQRITPILFAYIYFIVPAAAVIYMIVSSAIRILTQDLIFRYDTSRPAAAERSIPAATSDATDDVNPDGKVTPPTGSPNTNGAAKPPAAASTPPASKNPAAAKPPTQPPAHPRSRAKKKRKAR